MPYITAKSGIKWHYKTKGLGEILFFIHGWSGDCDAWIDQVDYFCDRYQVVTIDLPGHGKSSWKHITFNEIVDDLAQILDQFEQKINLIGTSFGGAIAINLATKFNDSIKTLTLVDTSAKFISTNDFTGALEQKGLKDLKSLIKVYYPNGLLIFYRNLFTSFERSQKNFASVWKKFKYRKQFPNKKSLLEFLDMMDGFDLRRELSKIKVKTLIVCGSVDKLFKKQTTEYLVENIENSKLVILENLGHVPFLTNPNIFNRTLDIFLTQKQAINMPENIVETIKI